MTTISFPGESPAYRVARDALLAQEAELRRATEAVAAARRALPPGGVVPEDYVFQGVRAGGEPGEVRLSELFAPGQDSLVLYSFMFPRDPGDDRPGPDGGRDRAAAARRRPVPVVHGAARPARRRRRARRPARRLRHRRQGAAAAPARRSPRSAAGATCGCCPRPATPTTATTTARRREGDQRPMLNVFHRDGATIRHFWGSELLYAPTEPGQDPRHVGTLEPLWNLFDLTPEGRGADWDEQLSYARARPAPDRPSPMRHPL